ncbi:MAG: hypothetical protein Q8T03_09850 [Bacteroidota bacterium]|nr:hypothetical protein [Bacteroidota bacterium]
MELPCLQSDNRPRYVLVGKPNAAEKENEAVPLQVIHEKKLHLIVVSKDLAYFEHIHPEYQADGSYQIKILPKGKAYTISKGHNETRFDNGGDYMLFADYAPASGNHCKFCSVHVFTKFLNKLKINIFKSKFVISFKIYSGFFFTT